MARSPLSELLQNLQQFKPRVAESVTRGIEFYRLQVVLAVGCRVMSPRGTQFRQWATAQLEQYLVKGFAIDDHVDGKPAAPHRCRCRQEPARRSVDRALDICGPPPVAGSKM